MSDQSDDTIRRFGEFALKIRGTIIDNINLEDVETIRNLMKLNLDKRALPVILSRLFNTYDGATIPYQLYYNIICGHISMEENVVNAMILRTLCCDGEHEEEKKLLMSSEVVPEGIKLMINGM